MIVLNLMDSHKPLGFMTKFDDDVLIPVIFTGFCYYVRILSGYNFLENILCYRKYSLLTSPYTHILCFMSGPNNSSRWSVPIHLYASQFCG